MFNQRPSNLQAYLRDRSDSTTTVHASTPETDVPHMHAVSPNHGILTPGQPVPALTQLRQTTTGVPMSDPLYPITTWALLISWTSTTRVACCFDRRWQGKNMQSNLINTFKLRARQRRVFILHRLPDHTNLAKKAGAMSRQSEPGHANGKKEDISKTPPFPQKILKVETNLICAIWGILQANLKKSSTLKFMMNTSFVPSICIHRSIILIFIKKKKGMLVDFFFHSKYFFRNFWLFVPRESSFRYEFQALILERYENTCTWST